MKNYRLKPWIRTILIFCGLALIVVLFVPLWQIDLDAPQYPEGLKLLIYPGKLAGDVDIINGLNHYIGMKTLHANDFPEFTFLPYIIAFFALFFIATGIAARRRLLYLLFFLFVIFGILAMYDFWRWEYNYGHNLNPDAAIVVPGMAYQPPLIGFKQLLNFGAYSMPAAGGWIFIAVGALLFFATVSVWRSVKKIKQNTTVPAMMIFMAMIALNSCNTGPEPITVGTDTCWSCKMKISNSRFGAELITNKGRVYKFDDAHCILAYLDKKEVQQGQIKNIYFIDYSGQHKLINVNDALLLRADGLKSPMGGNIAAFDSKDSLDVIQKRFDGTIITWQELTTD